VVKSKSLNREKRRSKMTTLMANLPIVLGALLAVSEVCGLFPQIKANGVFDAIVKVITYLQGINPPKV
jgi:hypothetical protein